jgi:signal transduction histidine kinase
MTAWYVALLALIVAAVGVFVVVRLRTDLTGAIDRTLAPASDQIARDYAKEGIPEFSDSAGTVLTGERRTAQLLGPDGAVIASFGDAVSRAPMIGRSEVAAALSGRRVAASAVLRGAGFRVAARRVVRDGSAQVLVAGQSLRPVQDSVRRVVIALLLAGPAALLATALGGWWLARRALRPIEGMTATAAAIGPERLGDRVDVPATRDEVAYLGRTLNTMLDRVQRGVEEQQRLVADASHELRTPLAAMRAEIDVSLRGDALEPAARDVLLSVREEVDRMSRTVDDLLTLADVDRGLVLAREDLDLLALARAVIAGLDAMAAARGVAVVATGEPLLVHADPDRLRHAIRNVVDNAIGFSPPGGTVTVMVEPVAGPSMPAGVDARRARVVVEDEGPGIPAEHRAAVFDRFHRADASRTRATGGSGLGLAITRDIVLAHGGAVDAGAGAGARGARMTIELPAAGASVPGPSVPV